MFIPAHKQCIIKKLFVIHNTFQTVNRFYFHCVLSRTKPSSLNFERCASFKTYIFAPQQYTLAIIDRNFYDKYSKDNYTVSQNSLFTVGKFEIYGMLINALINLCGNNLLITNLFWKNFQIRLHPINLLHSQIYS